MILMGLVIFVGFNGLLFGMLFGGLVSGFVYICPIITVLCFGVWLLVFAFRFC